VKKTVGVEIDATLIQLAQKQVPHNFCAFSTDKISFIMADLMGPRHEVWSQMEKEATVITMYFVENALSTLLPSLEKIMKQQPSCRLVTCGYPMPEWQPVKEERLLGLTLYLYGYGTWR
jgi:hypothetical protein